MNSKLLVIVGPTATGKTKLAGYLAKKFNGELISADSRQVYKGLDIGTGKEWIDGVKIHGYDLIDPKESFSVSQFVKFADKTIKDIQKRKRLPILVGGTGLYVRGVIRGIQTIDVPQNFSLRQELEKLSLDKLFDYLLRIDKEKALSLNSSDKANRVRLVRAIEVVEYLKNNSYKVSKRPKNQFLIIGLKNEKEMQLENIYRRVEKRVEEGIENEIKTLINKGVSWDDQSMKSLGYRQWRDYFEGNGTKDEVIKNWLTDENKYAKRQITWFKKEKDIIWFNASDLDLIFKVEKEIKKWDNRENV